MTRLTSKGVVESAIKWARSVFGSALLRTRLNTPPVPAARPRVGRWGTYYPAKYAKWKKLAEAEAETLPSVSTEGERFVIVDIVVAKPTYSKRSSPNGDVDNFAKAPLDALTKAEKIWADDNQIVGLLALKRFAEPKEHPGINIEVWNL